MDWKTAYARQADTDMDARDWLLQKQPPLPACHQLHFLQMAAEKLCKAHLIRSGTEAWVLGTSHSFVTGPLPVIVRQVLSRGRKERASPWLMAAVRKLARQIERLAPAIDAKGHPANCEYPWLDPTGNVVAPASYSFKLDINGKAGTTLLKAMRVAIRNLVEQTSD